MKDLENMEKYQMHYLKQKNKKKQNDREKKKGRIYKSHTITIKISK